MFRPFPLFIGLRYVRARRRTRFISVVSAVALCGLGLGVMALVVVLSVMNGFDRELRSRILALVPHVLVVGSRAIVDWEPLAAALEREPGVRGAAPFIGGTAMLSTPGIVRGVELSGIRPQYDARVSVIGQYMQQGALENLQPGKFGIVIGNLVARSLGLGIGDYVTVMLPEISLTPAGAYPRMRRFTVVGIFAVGAQVDASTALIQLEDAARLYRTGKGVHGVRLALDDPDQAPRVRARIAGSLPPGLHAEDWSTTQGTLFGAIRMEKRMVTLLLLVIVAVAAFNIVSILTMVVAEKRGAIAVLRTMGASPAQIMAVFTVQGTLIGVSGIAAGLAVGIPVALNISALAAWLEQVLGVRLFNPAVYFISYIPSHPEMGDLLLIAGCGLALSVLATLYPARRAARIGPAEALRYE
ncbi:MAG: lipoprotein-releasing ABC transporter permease subunit [Gammaproteobacteria bacterium]|jgi:lipoprotein-releasing system permease protein|nr:lipoprotein-releasing ABC transporter permease subunit [Gammaproteobacteria bacterium]MBP6051250.1 lipoprotein-releasing ABC transporter permease subunit [Pseudomonadales bacterium]MBK7522357.1 lipoprotein-releasing ABC transporter permease subunit [Gammaproteobacteria bacterium]MBK7728655.1 lipoprotein-releasing ABC transporter permease subunit [Gammaproteobacteria bacterium]MBK8307897.1 lipoprotein-releasing ABC transporter permease subunit [Gammaproteobacteria bacterium]